MKTLWKPSNWKQTALDETDAIRQPSTQPIGLYKYNHVIFSICDSQFFVK